MDSQTPASSPDTRVSPYPKRADRQRTYKILAQKSPKKQHRPAAVSKAMSSRKRADRGRSGGNGGEQGEQTIWDTCQDQIKKIMEIVQRSEACRKEIFAMEADMAELENANKSR